MTDELERAWPLGLYAPGSYTCACTSCGQEFVGDKRALNCLECAARRANMLLRSQRDGARQLEETARLRGASRDHDPANGSALEFKSPHRTDMTIAVVDVLRAVQSYFPRRVILSSAYTYGEYEIALRMAADYLSSAAQVEVPKSRDDVEALKAALAKAVEGLEPFARWAADNVAEEPNIAAERGAFGIWSGNRSEGEGIKDWFGPTDFLRALQALAAIRQGPRG